MTFRLAMYTEGSSALEVNSAFCYRGAQHDEREGSYLNCLHLGPAPLNQILVSRDGDLLRYIWGEKT